MTASSRCHIEEVTGDRIKSKISIAPMLPQKNITEFIHPELGKEITAIGGHYVFGKEIRMPYRGREILYFVGYAVLDSACCGVGGSAYVLVAGFIRKWKYRTSPDERPVSMVAPLEDHSDQKQLRKLIQKKEMVYQVTFNLL